MANLMIAIGAVTMNAGLFWALYRGVKRHLDESLALLSQELAEVVLKLAQSVPNGAAEAPNPMQMMLMQMIQGRMAQERGPTGQFKTVSVEKQDK